MWLALWYHPLANHCGEWDRYHLGCHLCCQTCLSVGRGKSSRGGVFSRRRGKDAWLLKSTAVPYRDCLRKKQSGESDWRECQINLLLNFTVYLKLLEEPSFKCQTSVPLKLVLCCFKKASIQYWVVFLGTVQVIAGSWEPEVLSWIDGRTPCLWSSSPRWLPFSL